MNKINPAQTRSTFFPNQKPEKNISKTKGKRSTPIKNNNNARKNELDQIAKTDTKIKIPTEIMEFAKIKSAVDRAPDIDNSEKIARLKEQIQNGTYIINYEGLADKLLEQQI